METVTHILSGALVARAIAPNVLSRDAQRKAGLTVGAATLCGAAAAAFPDIDIVANIFGQLTYLLNHRGITHSLIVLPLWALLFALLARQRQNWLAFYPYAFAGLLIHVLGDLITSYGTMILTPFSNARFEWGTTFIFDFWLSGIIIVGLLLSWRWRHSRLPALAALVAVVGYIGFQAVLKERAIDAGQAYARTNGHNGAIVNAMPQPFSPFRWMVVVKNADVYWYTHINLLHQEEALPAAAPGGGWFARFSANFRSVDQALWQRVDQFGGTPQEAMLSRHAFDQPGFAFYRWFATYPALYRIDRNQDGHCVWFQDLRFKFPGLERPTFRFGMCSSGNTWVPVRWVSEGVRNTL
ncbi:MAG: hydrolase [Proteobacteria bacterium]|nr:hydrolase [Pseudomonadota bacterium]